MNKKPNAKIWPKEQPVKDLSIDFKGKELHPCKGLSFIFWWGDEMFDIRQIRKLYARKECKHDDLKLGNPAGFCKKMKEIISLVGDADFGKVIEKAEQL